MGFEPMNVALRGLCVNHFTNRPNNNVFCEDIIILSLNFFLGKGFDFILFIGKGVILFIDNLPILKVKYDYLTDFIIQFCVITLRMP